jgi:hypothetical protein
MTVFVTVAIGAARSAHPAVTAANAKTRQSRTTTTS